jgi:hypothetical protein
MNWEKHLVVVAAATYVELQSPCQVVVAAAASCEGRQRPWPAAWRVSVKKYEDE